MSTAAKLDILIDIQTKLGQLVQTQNGIRELKAESNALGVIFRQGLGIGTGISIATTAIGLFKKVLVDSVREAGRFAVEMKALAGNLDMSIEALSALRDLVKDTDGNVNSLVGALNAQRASMVQARDVTSGAASALKVLGLDFSRLQFMAPERQFEAIAKSIASAHDKEAAFAAATQLLGERHVKNLRRALGELAEQGFDKVKASAEGANKYMTPQAIAQLAALQKGFGDKWDQFVAKMGNDLASVSTLFFGSAPVPTVASPSASDVMAAQALTKAREELVDAQIRLRDSGRGMEVFEGTPGLSSDAKRTGLLGFYREQLVLLERILELREKMPLAIENNETEFQRGDEISDLKARIGALQNAMDALNGKGQTRAYKTISETYRQTIDPSTATAAAGSTALTPGEGFFAGFMNYGIQTGTVGQQIATTLTGTIGGAVATLSEGIQGLITGTKTWGDVGRAAGQMFLQSLVQLGVQMAVNYAIGKLFREKEKSETRGATAEKAAEGGMKSIAQLGPIFGPLAFAASIAAIFALLGGFREHGGPVTAGVPYVVGEKRAEVFVPQSNGHIVSDAGSFSRNTPGLAAGSGVSAAPKPRVMLFRADSDAEFDAMRRSSNFDVVIVDTVKRHRGDILNS